MEEVTLSPAMGVPAADMVNFLLKLLKDPSSDHASGTMDAAARGGGARDIRAALAGGATTMVTAFGCGGGALAWGQGARSAVPVVAWCFDEGAG